MLYFLQSIDQFGVQQKLQITPLIPTQKSALGGLITLFLYGISLGYFLFSFYEWISNNKLPKVTFLQAQIDYAQKLKLGGIFADISYLTTLNNPIEPFNPENLIFMPNLQVISYDRTNIQNIPLKLSNEKLDNGRIIYKYLIQDLEFLSSPVNQPQRQQINYQLSLGYCNAKLLQDGQKCANQETIDRFFNQTNYFQVFIYIEQFDPRKKSLIKVPKYFVFDMIKAQLYFNQFILKIGELEMDDGFLFPNSNQQSYLSDLQMVTSQYDQDYSKNIYDQIKIVNMVEYPKISEILADTGSIITWILSISFIVSRYNENLCLQNTSKKVISMYYPDFTDFQIKKDWLGKLKSINCKQKEFDPQKSEEILNKLEKIVNQKMNYLNLQNEVAKLQFILQAHLGIQKIKNYLEQNHKLELLFEKLQIPEKYSKQSINQINVENDLQFERASQIGGENDSKINKDLILDQEVESIMGLLDIKTAEIGQIKEQNNFIQIQESSLNLINYLKVNNFEKPVEKK